MVDCALVTSYESKSPGLTELQLALFWSSRILRTETSSPEGVSAKFCEVPVLRSVRINATTSCEEHCHSPYSLEAKIKSKLKSLESGTKSNSKKAVSSIGALVPVASLMLCKYASPLVLSSLLN